MKVVIDGELYVKASSVEAPGVDQVMQFLYEQWMGVGEHWRDSEYKLWVSVGDDSQDGPWELEDLYDAVIAREDSE